MRLHNNFSDSSTFVRTKKRVIRLTSRWNTFYKREKKRTLATWNPDNKNIVKNQSNKITYLTARATLSMLCRIQLGWKKQILDLSRLRKWESRPLHFKVIHWIVIGHSIAVSEVMVRLRLTQAGVIHTKGRGKVTSWAQTLGCTWASTVWSGHCKGKQIWHSVQK